MKTFFVFVVICVISACTIFAQNPKWMIGAHFQPQYTFFYNSDDYETGSLFSNEGQIHFGTDLEVGYFLHTRFSIRTGIGYNRMGFQQVFNSRPVQRDKGLGDRGLFYYEYQNDYLNFPLSFCYTSNLENRLYVTTNVGFSLGVPVRNIEKIEYYFPETYGNIPISSSYRNGNHVVLQYWQYSPPEPRPNLPTYYETKTLPESIFIPIYLSMRLQGGLGLMVTDHLGIELKVSADATLTDIQKTSKNKDYLDQQNRYYTSNRYSDPNRTRPITRGVAIGMSLGAVYYWGKR